MGRRARSRVDPHRIDWRCNGATDCARETQRRVVEYDRTSREEQRRRGGRGRTWRRGTWRRAPPRARANEPGARRIHAPLRAQPRRAERLMTMRRFTVMGFTEAELGFVLAAMFAALAVAAIEPVKPEAANLAAKNDS